MDELVRALRENPDDRATWLVYADTLGDDPRAEAIVEGVDHPLAGDLLPYFITSQRHGFATGLQAPIDAGALIKEELSVAGARLVGSLVLRPRRSEDYGEWDVEGYEANLDLATLDLTQIHHIGICYYYVTRERPEITPLALLKRLQLGRLRSIDLRYDELDDHAIEELLPLCSGVETLRLQHNRITERGARMLAALPDLKVIDLRYNPIRGAATAFAGKKLYLNQADR
ncbi:MAG: hypothetical protein QM831_42820 [Kofleriaceae bacterium]